MTDVVGVKILDLIASGSSDDGEHVWITHRLGDGAEYPLVYPFEAIGYLITILADAARTAAERRVENHPEEVVDGADVNIIPATQVRVGTAPSDAGAILHLTTAERLALAVELPIGVLDEVIEQLHRVRQAISSTRAGRRHLH
jgi:hypothetical protein